MQTTHDMIDDAGVQLDLEPGLRVLIGRDGKPPLIDAADARAVRCAIEWQATGRRGTNATLTLGSVAELTARPLPCSGDGPGVLTVTFVATGEFQHFFADLGAGDFYLPDALSALVMAAATPSITGFARTLYQRAKCQELICEVIDRAGRADLVPQSSTASLSLQEMERLMAARQVIATRFDEKLTLSTIGRIAGLNRAKLTQGFREVFGQTVADCLAEHRLSKAAADLTATSRPVSVVGYGAGYLNNASFARAFTKRFGLCPTEFRRAGGRVAAAAA
ncbi:helix-turn-helix domain-containing protein [Brevundimonas lenta]|uniref:AraC family transcriptional activator of pyochelin receptor n=1 Tax=Brevundimonas lenta TaxID=424796 RepID=A0A7W6NNK7_9CAUL|nr:AraC family transcriptional regulator [Brevundimonas lenta]MBB4082455.1 AraC family transcriptional activator of pyochelin receptor [Brevundimonas lenta]